ncbi:TPA: hypothetical protein HA351_07295 [Methanosarcinaceae archaeon]|nr:hypothetical protein [Methanosarcinaceae archaeon]
MDLKLVYSFEDTREMLGSSKVDDYIYEYLKQLGATTAVVEENHLDEEYLHDYLNYHGFSFNQYSKYTKRIHFFLAKFSNEEFMKVILEGDSYLLETIKNSYCGFVVIKPVKDSNGNFIIGKTCLKNLRRTEEKHYINEEIPVSFFGIFLSVSSLPFQTSDPGVSSCAAVTCWTALYPFRERLGIPNMPLYEITEKAQKHQLLLDRNFPATGLSLSQIKGYINSLGLETEFIHFEGMGNDLNSDIIQSILKTYNNIGIPIIVAGKIEDTNSDNIYYHMFVISGYKQKNGIISELYVHDDQIGPYARIVPSDDFSDLGIGSYYGSGMKFTISSLLIPIFKEIRLNLQRIFHYYYDVKRKLLDHQKEQLNVELLLFKDNQYKLLLHYLDFDEKAGIICRPLPPFVSIIRISNAKNFPIVDIIFDATSLNLNPISHIVFNYEFNPKNSKLIQTLENILHF